MAHTGNRFVGLALAGVLLVGCSPDEGRTGEPVVTSPGPSASVAVPEPSPSPSATTASTPPSSLPATNSRTAATRPTVSSEPDGSQDPTATSPLGTSALGTATPTGTTDDGVPAGSAAWGQPFQFPIGLKVNVTRPTTFTPSAAANVPAGLTYVWVTVTLQNSSNGPIDIGIVGHDATAGGVEAVRIYDPANDILPTEQDPGQLAPGQVLSYRVAFAQMPREALKVRTMYGWDGQVVHE